MVVQFGVIINDKTASKLQNRIKIKADYKKAFIIVVRIAA
ncbi:hypothetical protein SAMN04487979_105131 [Flavobacterium sp. ov086]|nr:hypothetical protein SAMN04487979_105131 [Flavobacterium sp. ov086]